MYNNIAMHYTIKRLPLKKLFNTRDLGGLPTADGRKIKYGKLIRSGKLYNLPEETVEKLKAMNVTTVVDMRIYTEMDESPDTLWEGVKYIHLPVLCTATPGITREKSMRQTMYKESKRIKEEFGNADNYMAEMYRSVLLSEEPQRYLAQFLREVINNEECILWHCSGGKDRAGIAAMLVEELLGVDEEAVICDFVSSYWFQRKRFFWNKFGLYVVPVPPQFRKILIAMMAAKPQYLTTVMDEIKKTYGSITNYCKERLDVTDDDIALLKQKYLE